MVSFRLEGDPGYTVFDVSALLRSYGWQVPAYTMPEDATDVAVLRVVVREGFSANLARALRDDLVEVLDKLAQAERRRFRHTRRTSRTDLLDRHARPFWDNRAR